MKRIEAYQYNGHYILKNYASGRRNRFDVFKPNLAGLRLFRVGCELPIGHARRITEAK